MAIMGKNRRARLGLKPKEVRLVWMVGIAFAIIILLDLYIGIAVLTP